MANVINDETIDYVGILAKLELSEEEREASPVDSLSSPQAQSTTVIKSNNTLKRTYLFFIWITSDSF